MGGWVVRIGEPNRLKPTFTLPFWTRRAAEKEAAHARTKRGIGFIVTPYLSLPGQVFKPGENLWAEVVPVGWWDCFRRKCNGGTWDDPYPIEEDLP
jgi:hypothetical protein